MYGALRDKFDSRDYQFEEVAGSSLFDWNIPVDVEEKLARKIPVKNQNGSGSCGGQATSYYAATLEAVADGTFEERSAKFIYAQTHVGTGGSYARDNCEVVKSQGIATEASLPSYEGPEHNIPPSEAFITRSEDITQEIRDEAAKDKALVYVQVAANIDLFAQAIRDYNGLVFGIEGKDNGTWRTAFPLPPTERVWAHFLYAGKAKTINGKKYIGFLNSWGDTVGEAGWQWIGEDYFNSGHVWEGRTMVFENQNVPAKPRHKFIVDMKVGSRGAEVLALQQCLKYLTYFKVDSTGYFGNITKEAVKKYQTRWLLKADGIVGPKTRAKLNYDFNS